MKVLISLFLSIFILSLSIPSIHLIASPLTSLNSCGDTLDSYSQEDIDAVVKLSYEEEVTKVVESLEIPYPKVLHWIYQHERMLAEKNGDKVKSGSVAFLSPTYIIGVTDFADRVGVSKAARQVDIDSRALNRFIDRRRKAVELARQMGYGLE